MELQLMLQGRVLFDAFIYTTTTALAGIRPTVTTGYPVYVIEVDKSQLPNLKSHLQRYKLRSKFEIHDIPASRLQLFSIWPTIPDDVPLATPLVVRDPRSPHLGDRVLTPTPASAVPCSPLEIYQIRRTLHGVPENAEEIIPGSALPAESNLDVLSGIDYTKGCYVGQELTSRTFHTGVIRKRLLPMSLFPVDGEEPSML